MEVKMIQEYTKEDIDNLLKRSIRGETLSPEEIELVERRINNLLDKEDVLVETSKNHGKDYNLYMKNVKSYFNRVDKGYDKTTLCYTGGYFSAMRYSHLILHALTYNPNANRLLLVIVECMNKSNIARLTRGELCDMLGIHYSTLERALNFLLVNRFIRLRNGEGETLSQDRKRKRIMEIEVNHYIYFKEKYFDVYGWHDRENEDTLLRLEDRFYEPIKHILIDGAYVIVMEENGRIKRIKKENYEKSSHAQ